MSLTIKEMPKPAPKVPRDGNDKPLVIPSTGGKPTALVRTTTFVDALDDKTNLTKWKARGTLISAAKFHDVALDALKLDPEDKDDKAKLDALVEQLMSMGGFNDKREKGTHLHTLSEYVDQGIPLPPVSDADAADMAAYMLGTINMKVHKIEQFVVIEEVGCAGTLDRLVEFDGPGPDGLDLSGSKLIADLKTGRVDYGGLKIAAQLAAYSRGKVYDFTKFPAPDRASDEKAWTQWKKTVVSAEEAAAAYSPLAEDIRHDWGIVINLRPGSGQVELFWADLNIGWQGVLMAGSVREMRRLDKKALRPI